MTSIHRSFIDPSSILHRSFIDHCFHRICRACLSPWFANAGTSLGHSRVSLTGGAASASSNSHKFGRKKDLPLCAAAMESSIPYVCSISLGCLSVATWYSLFRDFGSSYLLSWKGSVCRCVALTWHTSCCCGTIRIFSSSDLLGLGINSPVFVIWWPHEDDKDDNE